MAYAEDRPRFRRPMTEHHRALANEWKRLTRIATWVAVLTSPALYAALHRANHNFAVSLGLTIVAVVLFRGMVEVLAHKLIPWASMYGADDETRADDLVARRRYWTWRWFLFKALPTVIVLGLLLLTAAQGMLWVGGVSAPFFNPWTALKGLISPANLVLLVLQMLLFPLFFLGNFLIIGGPMVLMSARAIRSYEPGDASWGVKMDDVRGQAEAKEEITRVISLWQSGDEFERAGGKRERGMLFLGAPGTGKTMISKAIATNFNCPFVTIPGSGFAGMFVGLDALTVWFLARKAKKLARKWGGQCIVFIDEIDAVGMRRQSLGGAFGSTPAGAGPTAMSYAPGGLPPINDFCFFGPNGSLTPTGDLIVESAAWRERLFASRAESAFVGPASFLDAVNQKIRNFIGGMGMNYSGQALNSLLVVMDGIGEPRWSRKFFTNRVNTFLDAMFIIPRRIGSVSLRLARPGPSPEQIFFIGACNVPLQVLDPALIRPGRMGRHIWFRTPTKDDRLDIFDLYLNKVNHEPDLDTEHRRDELARITNGYSPSMIEQCCSMALTIAHTEGRRQLGWRDIVEALTTVETGTAQNIEYIQEETRATAIHEAGHAAAGHVYLQHELLSTRLSIRKRGGSLGHYQSMEKEERFSQFRSRVMGDLIMTLGAMATEQVFYGENSQGVSGDVFTATAVAASMVGVWAMGAEPVTLDGSQEPDHDTQREQALKRLERIGTTIMNRSNTGGGMFSDNPLGAVLGDRDKRRAAAQIIGQAYVTAYALAAYNREPIERIADALIERKELHGDEVTDLLNSVGLKKPAIDLMDDRTWPKV
jgi:cell division protease FtsH